MPHPRVVRRDQPHDIYIGRPSKWGNPFVIGRDGTREDVVAKYREWFYAPEQSELRFAAGRELPGKVLGCFCAPLLCHGEVLAEFVDGTANTPIEALYFDPEMRKEMD